MSKNPPSFALPLQPVPVETDNDVVAADLDVCLSTPSTLVVNAELEVEGTDASGPRRLELPIVIPRSQCCGERPRFAALVEAARAAVARATRAGTTPLALLPRRVIAFVAGRPHLIAVL